MSPAYADAAVIDQFVTIGDAIDAGRAELLKNLRGRTVAMITPVIQGHPAPVLVKVDHLDREGLRMLLKQNLMSSRAKVTWRATDRLHGAGVPVSKPVALLEWRRWGVLCKTVYVGEYAPDARPITQVLQGLANNPTGKEALLTLLGTKLRAMHDAGFCHGDLKARNVLAERRTDGWMITFIDLENAEAKHRLAEEDRTGDLGRLWQALLPVTTPAERARWLDAYAAPAPAIDSGRLRQAVDRQVGYLTTRRFGDLPSIGAAWRGESTPRRWVLIASGTSQPGRPLTLLLNELRRGFPTAQLDVVVRNRAASEQTPDGYVVLAAFGSSGGPTRTPREPMSLIQAIRWVRSRRYDVAVDLTHTLVSALLTRTTGAGVRIGYRTASTALKWLKRITCYTQMIMTSPEHRHTAYQYLAVAEALGLEGLPPERFEPLPPAAHPEGSPS